MDLLYEINKNGLPYRRDGANLLPLAIGERPPGGNFLVADKKVTKEADLGESAQASLRQFAPSPKNPSRSLRMGTK